MATPTGDTAPPRSLGPLHLRLFALLLDYLLVVIALNLASQIFMGSEWDLHAGTGRSWGDLAYWTLIGGGLILAKDAWAGRSPGKWFLGIVVRNAEAPDQLPTRSALILRNLPLLILPVEAVLVFTDRFCRRIGDRWAGTVVVTPEQPPNPIRRALVFTCLVLSVLLAGFLIAPWNMKRSAAYQEATRQVAMNPDVVTRAGTPLDVEETDGFDLRITPEGGTAVLGFTATGSRSQVMGTVSLVLHMPQRQWMLDDLTLTEPEVLVPEDAAPQDRELPNANP